MATSLRADGKQVNQQSLSHDENWDMGGSEVKNPSAMQEPQEMQVRSLGREDPLEEGMATHSSILTWRSPWTEEPDGLQSTGSQRVGQNWSNWAHVQDLYEVVTGGLFQEVLFNRYLKESQPWIESRKEEFSGGMSHTKSWGRKVCGEPLPRWDAHGTRGSEGGRRRRWACVFMKFQKSHFISKKPFHFHSCKMKPTGGRLLCMWYGCWLPSISLHPPPTQSAGALHRVPAPRSLHPGPSQRSPALGAERQSPGTACQRHESAPAWAGLGGGNRQKSQRF